MPEKRIIIGELFEIYGAVLSEKQRFALDCYYNDDLSLSEIGEQIGITRQGVRDLLIHGQEQLFFLEEKLELYKNRKRNSEISKEIQSLTDNERIKELAAELI